MANCAGCGCGNTAPTRLTNFYQQLGFYDMDEDGVIEKKSFWNDEEGYKPKADINGDGRIIELEARYYLHHVMQNPPEQLKAENPLPYAWQENLKPLFIEKIINLHQGFHRNELTAAEHDEKLMPILQEVLGLGFFKLAKKTTELFETPEPKAAALLALGKQLASRCGAEAWLYGFDDLQKTRGELVQQAAEIAMDNQFDVTSQLIDLRYFDLAAEAAEYLPDPADEARAYSAIAREMCQSPLEEEQERGIELFDRALFMVDSDPYFSDIMLSGAVAQIREQIINDMAAAGQCN